MVQRWVWWIEWLHQHDIEVFLGAFALLLIATFYGF